MNTRQHRQLVRRFNQGCRAVRTAHLPQLRGIGTVAPTDNNHPVTVLRQLRRFPLALCSSITYCSKNPGVCIPPLQDFQTFFPFFHSKSGLGNGTYWAIFPLGMGLCQKEEFLFSPEYRPRTMHMAQNALHLRMILIPGHQNQTALLTGLAHQPVDLFHKGAGGIHTTMAAFFNACDHLFPHPMGADHNGCARGCLLRNIHREGPLLFQQGYHLLIVDNGPQGADRFFGFQQVLYGFHCPVHTKAKTGGFCNRNLHYFSPFSPLGFSSCSISRITHSNSRMAASVFSFAGASGPTPGR